eukprot:6193722-Pleurochrysis_carterae.AAC.1
MRLSRDRMTNARRSPIACLGRLRIVLDLFPFSRGHTVWAGRIATGTAENLTRARTVAAAILFGRYRGAPMVCPLVEARLSLKAFDARVAVRVGIKLGPGPGHGPELGLRRGLVQGLG